MNIHDLKHYISFYFPEFTYYIYSAQIVFKELPPNFDAYNEDNYIVLDEKLKKKSTEYVSNVIIHELLHMLLQHAKRGNLIKNVKPLKWNIACDLVVNNIMQKHGIKLSKDFLTIENNPNLVSYPSIPIDYMTAEEVYEYVVYDKEITIPIHGGVKIIKTPNIEIKEQKELPIELQHLRDTADKVNSTWSKIHRFNDDMPGKVVKSYKKVIIAVDVSSSMNEKVVNEILYALKNKKKVRLILWNNKVTYDGEPGIMIERTSDSTDPIKMLEYYKEKHYREPLYIVTDLVFPDNIIKNISKYLPEHCKVLEVKSDFPSIADRARTVISQSCEVIKLYKEEKSEENGK